MLTLFRFFAFIFFIFCLLPFIKAQDDSQSFLPQLESASVENGENLFSAKCSDCHAVCDQKLGPALTDVMKKRPIPWLVNFIQNSSEVIKSGDKYAQHLYDAYNHMEMPAFTELDRAEVLDILKYLKEKSDPNERDTVIKNTDEVSDLISKARNRDYDEDRGEVDYYAKETKERIPVDGASILNGKGIFQQHCQNCHEVCETKIGPALAGISKRRPLSWLLEFIDDPVEVVKTGDNYSNYVISNYNFIMPAFTYLDVEEKLDILAYIRSESSAEVSTSGVNSKEIAESPKKKAKEMVEMDDEEISQEDTDKEENSDIDSSKSFLQVGMVLLIVGLFSLMAFFLIRYIRT